MDNAPSGENQPGPKDAQEVTRVLLVDDQIMVAEAVRRLLADRPDIEYHYCLNPTKALEMAARLNPMVILLDLVMPGLSGIELTRHLRHYEPTARTPIIVLSTKEEATTKAQAFEAGADDYLIKLPDKLELEARIRVHANSYRNLLQYDQIVLGLRASEQRLLESNNALQSLNQAYLEACEEAEKAREAAEAAREDADRANGAKGDFLANMSHEIRTPLNAVLGMTHLALQTPLDDKQFNYLKKIETSGRNLLSIINDILDFSKIEAGKLDIEKTNFSLEGVVHSVAEMFALKAEEKDVELQFLWMPDVPSALVGDPLRIGQVLINLVGNALKFTESGEVVVRVEKVREDGDGVELRFTVRDTGIGLTPEQSSRLFRAFTQADISVSRKFGGTGLGLAICQRLVELMGGSIGVESSAGRGSTFHFSLPFKRQTTAPLATEAELEGLRGLRALVVDDSPMSREILCAMMQSFRFQCDQAECGKDGMRMWLESPGRYDLILMDWRMPEINGIETVARMRTSPLGYLLPPVIMISAYGREELACQAEGVNIAQFLIKPVTQSLLFDTIMQVLGKRANRDTVRARGEDNAEQSELLAQVNGKHVLLVEDNEINQEVAREILMQAGVVVSVAEDGQQAIDILEAARAQGQRYDAVLMDCQMPVLDGFEATRRLRSSGHFDNLPIIAMTANAMASDKEDCLAAGMDDHVTKPITVTDLFRTLAHWTNGAQRSTEAPALAPAPEELASEPNALNLPGVDLELGLSHVCDDENLYRRILFKFRDGQTNTIQEIRNSYGSGDLEKAIRLAHTLKGVAGTIGAQSLYHLAHDIETMLKEGACLHLEDSLDVADRMLRPILTAIDALEARANPRPAVTPGTARNQVEVNARLENLKRHLLRYDTRAAEEVRALKSMISDVVHLGIIQQVEDAIQRFEFDEAQKHVPVLDTLVGQSAAALTSVTAGPH